MTLNNSLSIEKYFDLKKPGNIPGEVQMIYISYQIKIL